MAYTRNTPSERPSPSQLRNAGAATWGAPQTSVLPPIIASNYRPIGKGTLVGSVDLYVTKWRFHFYGALWHKEGKSQWISFPARQWHDDSGKTHYVALGKFDAHDDARRFSEAAIAAIRLIAGDAP
jgi:hypothetical protein